MGNKRISEKDLSEYASVLSDTGFKAVLASERNKELLRQLINLILPEDRHVVEIEHFENREATAKKLLAAGISIDVIASCTGLSIEEVKSLAE